MKVRRLTSIAAVFAVAMGLGTAMATTTNAVPLEKVPFTITNNSGVHDAQLYVGVMGVNPATGRDAYLVRDGATWRLQDIPGAAGFPSPPQPLNGVMFSGPAVGQSLTVQTPHITSGRLYYSWGQPLQFMYVKNDLGQDKIVYPDHHTEPNRSILHGSAEYTYDANNVLWYNSTQVDYFGPPAQVGIADANGHISSTGRLINNGFDYVRTELEKHGEWSKLVDRGPYNNVLRVLNPSHKLGHDGFNAGNLQQYIDQVWNHYRNTDMRIRPILENPNLVFTGRVGGDNVFRFNAPGYSQVAINKPTPWEALACAGPLTGADHQGWIARTLCAGFNRSNMLSYADQPTTDDKFHADSQWTNWYVKIVHEAMATGHAYGFAYDDVGGYESLTAIGNPTHAYLQLDPFSGSAAPIGDEGSHNGGGNNGGGNQPTLPAGTGKISVAGHNMCVDIPWANPANSTQVQIVNCSGNDAQKWTRGSDGTIKALGACLDVRASGTANGTPVQVYQCNNTAAQKWVYDTATKALKNPQSGKCLDVPSSQFNDGQKLQIWNCNQTNAQRWEF